jgi:hypothetical protein
MAEFLCKEIVADIIGVYLLVYRDTCAFRREYEPVRLAKQLTEMLTQRGRVVVKVLSGGSGKGTLRNKNARSILLVNNQCLVVVMKVVHLRSKDFEGLEKQVNASELDVGLALNFGSRTPEFWRVQKNHNQALVQDKTTK